MLTSNKIFLIIALIAFALFLAWPEPNWDKVMYVIDGDTLNLEDHGDVRLEYIDAPEIGTERGGKAERYVQKLLKDCEQVKVITDGEYGYYNRLLAEIETCEGVNIGDALLKKGLAEPYRE